MVPKAWGRFTRLHLDDRSELRRTEIVEGGFCSRHFHNTKAEVFTVLSGSLLVKLFAGRDNRVITQTGSSVIATAQTGPVYVPAKMVHQFLALTDVVAYEFYRSVEGELMQPDEIHRFSESGVK